MNYSELLSIEVLSPEMNDKISVSSGNVLKHTTYRDEIHIFSCVKEGNVNKLFEVVKNLNSNIFVGKMANDDIMQNKYMAVSCITLATRYAIQGGLKENAAYEYSDEFIRSIDKLKKSDEIISTTIKGILELTQMVDIQKKKPQQSPHIRKALIYVENNINKKITVSTISEHLGINANYLSHLFSTEMGEKLSAYILRKKLETAKTMIFEGYDNIKICYALGFSSQSHFISSFKKHFDMTPKEFASMIK